MRTVQDRIGRRLDVCVSSAAPGTFGTYAVLMAECEASPGFAAMVHGVVSSSLPMDDRIRELVRVLSMFGVGTVVTGRLS